MAHKHYCGCKHNLEYCNCCDKVYCTKCGKEWRNTYWSFGVTTTDYPWYLKGVDCTTSTDITSTNTVACTHKKKGKQ